MPKNLQKSKSEEQISLAPPLVERSKSAESQSISDPKYPYTTLISQTQELEKLRKESETKSTTISLLRKKIERLESKNFTTSELDSALVKRHQNLKDWFTQYQKSKRLDKELVENIEQASNELTDQDETISQLRGEVRKLKQTQQSLEKDLELAHKLAELRKSPLPFSEGNFPWTVYALTFCLIGTVLWLTIK